MNPNIGEGTIPISVAVEVVRRLTAQLWDDVQGLQGKIKDQHEDVWLMGLLYNKIYVGFLTAIREIHSLPKDS